MAKATITKKSLVRISPPLAARIPPAYTTVEDVKQATRTARKCLRSWQQDRVDSSRCIDITCRQVFPVTSTKEKPNEAASLNASSSGDKGEIDMRRYFAGAVVLSLLMAITAFSQNGSLGGTVSDPTGALIPGVEIKATNTATGVVTTTLT